MHARGGPCAHHGGGCRPPPNTSCSFPKFEESYTATSGSRYSDDSGRSFPRFQPAMNTDAEVDFRGSSWIFSAAENRIFPKFQPSVMNSNAAAGGSFRRRSSVGASDLPQSPQQAPELALSCTRPHSLGPPLISTRTCCNKADAVVQPEGRQICCSGHPKVAGCCSARTPHMPWAAQRTPGKVHRVYGAPPPLGSYCSARSDPLASLTAIYQENANLSMDEEGEEGWENGSVEATPKKTADAPVKSDEVDIPAEEGADLTATHSCALSSASPEEARRGCCRRPSDQPQQLQVLLQEHEHEKKSKSQKQTQQSELTNTNHPKVPEQERQRRLLASLLPTSAKPSSSAKKTASKKARKRSKTQPPPPLPQSRQSPPALLSELQQVPQPQPSPPNIPPEKEKQEQQPPLQPDLKPQQKQQQQQRQKRQQLPQQKRQQRRQPAWNPKPAVSQPPWWMNQPKQHCRHWYHQPQKPHQQQQHQQEKQQQRQEQEQQQRERQQRQEQQQRQRQQRIRQLNHLRSLSSPAPLGDTKIYNNNQLSESSVEDGWPQQQPLPQQHHIHRRPFAGLMRSRDSVAHLRHDCGCSSSLSEL